MSKTTDASQKLVLLVELLRTLGGFDLTARVQCLPASEPPPRPELLVNFEGPDTPLLTARNGELLHAIEHLAAKVLNLEPEDHDRICFDADNFKSKRDRELH